MSTYIFYENYYDIYLNTSYVLLKYRDHQYIYRLTRNLESVKASSYQQLNITDCNTNFSHWAPNQPLFCPRWVFFLYGHAKHRNNIRPQMSLQEIRFIIIRIKRIANTARHLILSTCSSRVFSSALHDIEDKDMILNTDFDEYFIDSVKYFYKKHQ